MSFYSKIYQGWFALSVMVLVVTSLVDPYIYSNVALCVATVSLGLFMYRLLKHFFFQVRSWQLWLESIISFLPGLIALGMLSNFSKF